MYNSCIPEEELHSEWGREEKKYDKVLQAIILGSAHSSRVPCNPHDWQSLTWDVISAPLELLFQHHSISAYTSSFASCVFDDTRRSPLSDCIQCLCCSVADDINCDTRASAGRRPCQEQLSAPHHYDCSAGSITAVMQSCSFPIIITSRYWLRGVVCKWRGIVIRGNCTAIIWFFYIFLRWSFVAVKGDLATGVGTCAIVFCSEMIGENNGALKEVWCQRKSGDGVAFETERDSLPVGPFSPLQSIHHSQTVSSYWEFSTLKSGYSIKLNTGWLDKWMKEEFFLHMIFHVWVCKFKTKFTSD